jgi:hypothetical protein
MCYLRGWIHLGFVQQMYDVQQVLLQELYENLLSRIWFAEEIWNTHACALLRVLL